MGFKLSFKGGPNNGEVVERRSAPNTVISDGDGHYRLKDIKGRTAHYVWKDDSTVKRGEQCDGFGG